MAEKDTLKGYKKTDVGVIPEGWGVIPIGQAGQVIGGRQRSPSNRGNLCKYLRVANVFDGSIDTSDIYEMRFSDLEYKRFLLRIGDILLNEGQSLELVGRSAIYRGEPSNCCFQNTLIRFRANVITSIDFAQLVFQSYLRSGIFASIALQTTSIAHLGTARLAALKIPLPPIGEQRAIATALSDINALIAGLDQLIAKKRTLKQAAMQQLLTGQKRLPGFQEEWKKKILSDVGGFSKGQGIKKDEVLTEGIPCIRYGEIYTTHNDYIRQFFSFISREVSEQSRKIRNGDLLFAGSGETTEEIGKCVAFLGEEEAFAGGDIVIFSPADQNSLFLGYLLNHSSVVAQKSRMGQGDAVVHISAKNLAKLEFNLPSFEEQAAIATVLSDMDAELAALEERRHKTRLLKQGMMQELLTGRIRLVSPSTSAPTNGSAPSHPASAHPPKTRQASASL